MQIAESRCCDGMTGYIARNRTKDLAASKAIVSSIKTKLARTDAVRDLAVADAKLLAKRFAGREHRKADRCLTPRRA